VIAPLARNDEMTNGQKVAKGRVRHSRFVIDSSFVVRDSSFSARRAFTLIELIVVIAVIIILAGLILSTVGYVQKKSARARAETEIAAMSAACENYKADNGIYPRDASSTDVLDARVSGDPSNYQAASLYLYKQLSGDSSGNRSPTGKSYMEFKPKMLLPAGGTGTVTAIADPFGNSYGYSTANQTDPTKGYNPTFDLWSTSGLTTNPPGTPPDTVTPQWIKNW
jgi:prepilin-type N-terminal cleavage/methylation domain-containing protein